MLVLDEGKCGASTDHVFADASLSSVARARLIVVCATAFPDAALLPNTIQRRLLLLPASD